MKQFFTIPVNNSLKTATHHGPLESCLRTLQFSKGLDGILLPSGLNKTHCKEELSLLLHLTTILLRKVNAGGPKEKIKLSYYQLDKTLDSGWQRKQKKQ